VIAATGLYRSELMRKCLAGLLCLSTSAPLSWAQASQTEAALPIKPSKPFFIRSYRTPEIPNVQLTNSSRLAGLVRGGKLYLTVQDAIALAIENNIDVQVARYTPILDAWNLARSEAGGALPGVPAAATQATSVAKGQGVRGSQAAAGVSSGGSGGGQGSTVNATVTQIGPVTPTLDPVFQDSNYFSHISQPQANLRVSQVANLIENTRNYTTSLQSGYLLGGQASVTYNESYLSENAPTDVLNPTYAPTLQATIQQNFLQGFGLAVNSRNINISKLNLKLDELNFRSQIISVVVNVLNLYYGLVADYDDLHAKQSALTVAQQFYENNRKQVQLGTMAPLDITSAEAQVAASQQSLVTSQVAVDQQQISLKGVLSRVGSADPLLREVQIIPLDRIDVPQEETLPKVSDLVAQAMKNRVDIASQREHLDVDRLTSLGTGNGVLPQLAVQVSASTAGLAGTNQYVPRGALPEGGSSGGQFPPGFGPCPPPNTSQVCEVSNPYLRGGLGTALGQMFRRNYPTQGATAFYNGRLRNRQAQADATIDLLTMRQDQLQLQKDSNQVAVDVSNQVVALQQARVRYLAAIKNRVLEQQLLDAEQKKFGLGASTPYNVVSQQRDLATAQSSETAALVAYSSARIALGQTVGTTLEDTHVSIEDAKSGRIARQSVLPSQLPGE
jgi:outer membrane protein